MDRAAVVSEPPANSAESGNRGPGTAAWGLLGVVAAVILIRIVAENRMMAAHGPDAQMGIWFMFSMIIIGFWLLVGLVAWLPALALRNRLGVVLALFFLGLWSCYVTNDSWKYFEGASALRDASNPATSAERLAALAHFGGLQADYELDNRVASHPNTSPQTLRELYRRGNLGTLMKLAVNPHTPSDVLEELATNPDEWVQKGLKENPSVEALDDRAPPADGE